MEHKRRIEKACMVVLFFNKKCADLALASSLASGMYSCGTRQPNFQRTLFAYFMNFMPWHRNWQTAPSTEAASYITFCIVQTGIFLSRNNSLCRTSITIFTQRFFNNRTALAAASRRGYDI